MGLTTLFCGVNLILESQLYFDLNKQKSIHEKENEFLFRKHFIKSRQFYFK